MENNSVGKPLITILPRPMANDHDAGPSRAAAKPRDKKCTMQT
jgi:hypothetical protein